MKYNAYYDRWVTEDGKVYRQDKEGDLVEQKPHTVYGYLRIGVSKPKPMKIRVHRLVYETFKGPIPDGMEIDHFDTNKENNSLDNLILCSHKENCNNKLTVKRQSDSHKGKPLSDFGRKFKERYSLTYTDNPELYQIEYTYYKRHNKKCQWE